MDWSRSTRGRRRCYPPLGLVGRMIDGLLRLKMIIVRSCHDRHEEDDEEQARLGQVDMGIVYVGYDDDDI